MRVIALVILLVECIQAFSVSSSIELDSGVSGADLSLFCETFTLVLLSLFTRALKDVAIIIIVYYYNIFKPPLVLLYKNGFHNFLR